MLPVCTDCGIQMSCAKNDYVIRRTFYNGTGIYYYGDKYECAQCHLSIVTGFGKRQHFEPGDKIASQKHNLTVLKAYSQDNTTNSKSEPIHRRTPCDIVINDEEESNDN